MKSIIIIFLSFFIISEVYCQSELFERVKKKTEEKIEEAIEGKKDNQETDADKQNESKDKNEKLETKDEIKIFSKFDFIPGEKVIFYDDFSQDNIGDFPKLWNTNGTGEVVNLSGFSGKWLKMKGGTLYQPEISKPFPENFTIEFDLILDEKEEGSLGSINLGLIAGDENKEFLAHSYVYFTGTTSSFMDFNPRSNDRTRFIYKVDCATNPNPISSDLIDDVFRNKYNKIVRISISVNKQRYRFWVDQKKVLDLPRGLPEDKYEYFKIGLWGFNDETQDMYKALISNFRCAVGQIDTRSKLLTEGKLISYGINFDVASDKIKPTSYGTLKEISTVLKDNSLLKIKIIGHTDSDGTPQANMELSSKRAAAVKNFLIQEFGIEENRIITEGKGASEPISPNDSPNGKANNRRVEFIKL